MRDSLDLDALQRQLERISRLNVLEKRLRRVMLFGFGMLVIIVNAFSRLWFENETQFLVVVVFLLTPPFLNELTIAFSQEISGIRRVQRYKPDFVQSASWNNIIVSTFLIVYTYSCCIYVGYQAYIESPSMFLGGILIALPIILNGIYYQFYRWSLNNMPQSLERVRFLLPYNYLLNNLQHVLQIHTGAYTEALESQRAILSGRFSLNWRHIVLELDNYAATLIELERYEEAIPLLETAIRIHPTFGTAYSTLAYSYLKREIELERAAQLIQYDLTYSILESPSSYSLALAQQAYVAALLKRLDQVEEPFELAQDYAVKAYSASAAGVYWRLGETARVLGDPIRAYDLYSRTIETDPSTIYAQRAREQLTTILL